MKKLFARAKRLIVPAPPAAPPTPTNRDVRNKRRRFLEAYVPVASRRVLEIGAFDQPLYTKDEANVRYLDRFSRDELEAAHGHIASRAATKAVEPDYVCKSPLLSAHISDRFDLIVASHVIEHVPNLLGWLDEIAALTTPRGRLFLAIPDRRYTFDYLRRESSLAELIRNRDEALETPSVYQIFDQIHHHRKLSLADAWSTHPASCLGPPRFVSAEAAWTDAKIHAQSSRVDIHCNVFSYESFLRLFGELESLAGARWRLVVSAAPVPLSNEFLVLLERRD